MATLILQSALILVLNLLLVALVLYALATADRADRRASPPPLV